MPNSRNPAAHLDAGYRPASEGYWVTYARNLLFDEGYHTSAWQKAKRLTKFGRNDTVGTSPETVMQLVGSEINETFVSTNLIDQVSSSSISDAGKTFIVEGHTIDAVGNLTFVVQSITLDGADGRTPVLLTTPLARSTRIYLANSGTFDAPQVLPVGDIYVYDNTGGHTLGVPNTDSAVKVHLLPGSSQSQKCSTSISQSDAWLITHFSGGISKGTNATDYVEFDLETRDVKNGGVWRPLDKPIVQISGQSNMPARVFEPYKIVRPNHDVRVVAFGDTGSTPVYASLQGVLVSVEPI